MWELQADSFVQFFIACFCITLRIVVFLQYVSLPQRDAWYWKEEAEECRSETVANFDRVAFFFFSKKTKK
jgi:hypothetical protein